MNTTVEVHLKEQSRPIVYHDVINSYQKGGFFCVYCESGVVFKHPIADIFRVKEEYGPRNTEAQ